jgi:hypothetical protein
VAAGEIALLGKMPLNEEFKRFNGGHGNKKAKYYRKIKKRQAEQNSTGIVDVPFRPPFRFVADQQLSSFTLFICGIPYQDSA